MISGRATRKGTPGNLRRKAFIPRKMSGCPWESTTACSVRPCRSMKSATRSPSSFPLLAVSIRIPWLAFITSHALALKYGCTCLASDSPSPRCRVSSPAPLLVFSLLIVLSSEPQGASG